jgi:hypothetical protein
MGFSICGSIGSECREKRALLQLRARLRAHQQQTKIKSEAVD